MWQESQSDRNSTTWLVTRPAARGEKLKAVRVTWAFILEPALGSEVKESVTARSLALEARFTITSRVGWLLALTGRLRRP